MYNELLRQYREIIFKLNIAATTLFFAQNKEINNNAILQPKTSERQVAKLLCEDYDNIAANKLALLLDTLPIFNLDMGCVSVVKAMQDYNDAKRAKQIQEKDITPFLIISHDNVSRMKPYMLAYETRTTFVGVRKRTTPLRHTRTPQHPDFKHNSFGKSEVIMKLNSGEWRVENNTMITRDVIYNLPLEAFNRQLSTVKVILKLQSTIIGV